LGKNTVQTPDLATIQPDLKVYELKVSSYERVASMLLALLALIGLSVLIMFILWLTGKIFAAGDPLPLQLEEIGTGEGPFGGMELDAPLAEELGQETDLEEPAIENTLASIADAVSTQQSMLDDPALTDEVLAGKGGSTGDGRGTGLGSGPGGTGRYRRWEVRFAEGNTVDTYARQLDYFKIHLGVLMPNNRVAYAYNLSKPRPDRREGPADQERRYYLSWTKRAALEEADRALLDRANIEPGNNLILKFIPPELELELQRLEKTRAGREADNIRATYFGIRPKRGGYEFFVADQTYR
jgi:hypothetical protein